MRADEAMRDTFTDTTHIFTLLLNQAGTMPRPSASPEVATVDRSEELLAIFEEKGLPTLSARARPGSYVFENFPISPAV